MFIANYLTDDQDYPYYEVRVWVRATLKIVTRSRTYLYRMVVRATNNAWYS